MRRLSAIQLSPSIDLQGGLLGLNCKSPSVGYGDPIHASAILVAEHWDDLVAGKNLDRTRLFTEQEKIKETELPEGGAKLSISKAASVRISSMPDDEKETFASGTIISSDGYVITCGHHERLPGEKLQVTLGDGRSAKATASARFAAARLWLADDAVSYTHLTLPTKA